MELDAPFLRTRVARRILLFFVVGALLPVALLGVVTYPWVSAQLTAQGRDSLEQASKALGMGVYERLQILRTGLDALAPRLGDASEAPVDTTLPLLVQLEESVRGIVVVGEGGTTRRVLADVGDLPALDAGQREHLRSGKTLLTRTPGASGRARVLLAHPAAGGGAGGAVVWAELDVDAFFGRIAEARPGATELCVLDEAFEPLYCTASGASALESNLGAVRRSARGVEGSVAASPGPVRTALEALLPGGGPRNVAGRSSFEWHDGDEGHLAGEWSIFLRADFGAPSWSVLLSEPKETVLGPVAFFRQVFPPALLLSLLLALLASNVQIRKSLVPLERLREGTRRIAARDFERPVTVDSGDEFEDLAHSFNAMAKRLKSQFEALTTMNEIDRAVLSALDPEAIVSTVLRRIGEIVPCDGVAVTLLEERGAASARTYLPAEAEEGDPRPAGVSLSEEEVRDLAEHPEWTVVEGRPSWLEIPPLRESGLATWVVFPIFVKEEPAGAIALGYEGDPRLEAEDRTETRQLADQVSVALSNAGLVEELDQLTWGALVALARVIDAKSPWTAGHSERVTRLCVAIGRQMGRDGEELELLRRGAILHDIGKVAVPGEILDKPGPLNEEEWRVVRSHTEVGTRILEPISQYADVLPLVGQHHERLDGSGYPRGLRDGEIHWGARILAVADVFDAVTSDRPYRAAVDPAEGMRVIRKDAGVRFDADVVRAFERAAEELPLDRWGERGGGPEERTDRSPVSGIGGSGAILREIT